MTAPSEPITILMADDDADDRDLTAEALRECRWANNLRFVEDGRALLDYLNLRGAYAGPDAAPRPALILLDLNMPGKNGCEALAEIKADPRLRGIPVVAFTTSDADEDVRRAYDLGANSYVTKPITFDGLVAAMHTLGCYWLELVELPQAPGGAR